MFLDLLRCLIVFTGELAGFLAADDPGKELGQLETARTFDADRPRGHLPRRADFDLKFFSGHALILPLPIADADLDGAVFRHFFGNDVHVPLLHFGHHAVIDVLLSHAINQLLTDLA